jgi:hypothetical protein
MPIPATEYLSRRLSLLTAFNAGNGDANGYPKSRGTLMVLSTGQSSH